MPINHAFVSGLADSSNPALVNPSNWNAGLVETSTVYTATAGQTIFKPGYPFVTRVYKNGLKMVAGVDYYDNSGEVIFNYPLPVGTTVEVI